MSTKDGEADGDAEDPAAEERRTLSKQSLRYKRHEHRPQDAYSPTMTLKGEINQHCESAYAVARNQTHSTQQPKGCTSRTLSSRTYTPRSGEIGTRLILIPPCMFHHDIVELIQDGPAEPPVTTETLQELDLVVIKNNPSLRIDVNYDHDLHFMPISGSRGEEKRVEAEKYFRCILYELSIYQHNAEGDCTACKEGDPDRAVFPERLSSLFDSLKDLLFMLVPEGDHQAIIDNVDVNLRVQEVHNGVFDISRFATWLQVLLTNHCAPIRDDWASDMASTLTEAAAKGDTHGLVQGLEKLFAFLECMRLDVANHQIRTFRAPLIEDGIAFQIDYFEARIYEGRLNINGSRQWFRSLCQNRCTSDSELLIKGQDVLVRGLVELCSNTDSALPITFKYDGGRLRAIQREVQDEISLRACREVFRRLTLRLMTGKHSPASSLRLAPSRLMDLVEDDSRYRVDQLHELWFDNVESLATEITRQAYNLLGVAPSAIPANMFAATTTNLATIFNLERQQHCIAEILTTELEARVLHWCHKFHKMTALEISEHQRREQQRKVSPHWVGTGRSEPDLEGIARRLAHMATIHWRVWRGLAYLDREVCEAFGIFDEDVPVDFGIDFECTLEDNEAESSLNVSREDDDGAVWEEQQQQEEEEEEAAAAAADEEEEEEEEEGEEGEEEEEEEEEDAEEENNTPV